MGVPPKMRTQNWLVPAGFLLTIQKELAILRQKHEPMSANDLHASIQVVWTKANICPAFDFLYQGEIKHHSAKGSLLGALEQRHILQWDILMDRILYHLRPWATIACVGIYRGIIIPGFLGAKKNIVHHSSSNVPRLETGDGLPLLDELRHRHHCGLRRLRSWRAESMVCATRLTWIKCSCFGGFFFSWDTKRNTTILGCVFKLSSGLKGKPRGTPKPFWGAVQTPKHGRNGCHDHFFPVGSLGIISIFKKTPQRRKYGF